MSAKDIEFAITPGLIEVSVDGQSVGMTSWPDAMGDQPRELIPSLQYHLQYLYAIAVERAGIEQACNLVISGAEEDAAVVDRILRPLLDHLAQLDSGDAL